MYWKVLLGTQRWSVNRNSEVAAIREHKMYCVYVNSSRTSTVLRYLEEVSYWEGALSEVPLYNCKNTPSYNKMDKFSKVSGVIDAP